MGTADSVFDAWYYVERECKPTLLPSEEKHEYSIYAPKDQALGVFTGVVVIISVGSLIVTVQAKVRRRDEHEEAS